MLKAYRYLKPAAAMIALLICVFIIAHPVFAQSPPPSPVINLDDQPSSGGWAGFLLLLLFGMVFLMIFGVGAAILLVRLRDKFR